MRNFLQKLKTNAFYRIYMFVLLPIVVLMIFLLGFIYYYNIIHVEMLKNTYSYKLDLTFQENENEFHKVITDVRHLISDEKVINSMANASGSTANAIHAINSLRLINGAYDIIDSIAFLNFSDNTVISINGNSHLDKYLNDGHRYVDYNLDFWKHYQSPLANVQILAPTTVYEWSFRKDVLPIVFSRIDSGETNNLLVVNLSIPVILSTINKESPTKNSSLTIFNKQTRQVFMRRNEAVYSIDDDLYKKIANRTSAVVDYTSENENKSLIIFYSPENMLLGYGYAASIPYGDIYHNMLTGIIFICIIIAFLLFAVSAASYFSAKKIYSPIENLALMSNQYVKAFPLIQERYLVNLLNSDNYNADEQDLESILEFKYEYFASVVIRFRPTDSFYDNCSYIVYELFQTSVNDLIKTLFTKKYETFVVSSDKDTLYVLLNLENVEQDETIINITEHFKSLMENDKEFINLYIGIGNIYKGLDGLKKTHEEAVKSVSTITGFQQNIVKTYSQPNTLISYVFGEKDENALHNYLLAGYCDKAKELISASLEKCVNENVSERAVLQFNMQIINIIFKVMRMRKIPYDDLNDGDFKIISNIVNHPPDEICNIIFELVDKIDESTTGLNSKIDIHSVVQYIESNYSSELYLEGMAQEFNTTGKYLSKLFINKLGISFLEYLNNLRINKAKILLVETKKNITEIYQEVGFNNRNTFMRVFKKVMGINPSDYRKANSRNKK